MKPRFAKPRSLRGLFVLAVFASVSISHASEGSAGNGVDTITWERGHAWFTGQGRTLRYCSVVAPDFGVPAPDAQEALRQAISTWDDYIVRKGILEHSFTTVHSSEKMPVCDGSEDVKVYFGGNDDRVQRASANFTKPFAFAQLESYHDGWGKGMIWVAPMGSMGGRSPAWSTGQNLLGVLLHEFGHVHGCGHVPGTVMDEKLGSFLTWDAHLGSIDRQRELVSSPGLAEEFPLSSADGDGFAREAFYKLVGRPASGSVTMTFSKEAGAEFSYSLPHGKLKVSDRVATYSFQVESKFRLTEVDGDVPVFKQVAGQTGFELRSVSYSWFGSLRMKLGGTLPVIIAQNDGTSRFSISSFSSDEAPKPIFVSTFLNR